MSELNGIALYKGVIVCTFVHTHVERRYRLENQRSKVTIERTFKKYHAALKGPPIFVCGLTTKMPRLQWMARARETEGRPLALESVEIHIQRE